MTHIIFALYLAFLALDYLQTLTIARNPDKWHETNPILGPHPPEEGVNLWFLIVAVVSCIAYWYFADWRMLSIAGVAVEGYYVVRNHRLGIRPADPRK